MFGSVGPISVRWADVRMLNSSGEQMRFSGVLQRQCQHAGAVGGGRQTGTFVLPNCVHSAFLMAGG
jgi:hypothetical protein